MNPLTYLVVATNTDEENLDLIVTANSRAHALEIWSDYYEAPALSGLPRTQVINYDAPVGVQEWNLQS